MTFDETAIRCSAPTLCGLKPSCLFTVCTGQTEYLEKIRQWNGALRAYGKQFVIVRRLESHRLVFVYDTELLQKILAETKHYEYLVKKGYPVFSGFRAVLRELYRRLAHGETFPHEIGIFLGYPLDDVRCFENNARPRKYTGAWVAYGNVDAACKTMRMYQGCSRHCCKLLDMGMQVPDISKNYSTLLEAS